LYTPGVLDCFSRFLIKPFLLIKKKKKHFQCNSVTPESCAWRHVDINSLL